MVVTFEKESSPPTQPCPAHRAGRGRGKSDGRENAEIVLQSKDRAHGAKRQPFVLGFKQGILSEHSGNSKRMVRLLEVPMQEPAHRVETLASPLRQ